MDTLLKVRSVPMTIMNYSTAIAVPPSKESSTLEGNLPEFCSRNPSTTTVDCPSASLRHRVPLRRRAVLLAALFIMVLVWPAGQAQAKLDSLEGMIHRAARHEGVDPLLLESVVAAESAFNPYSVSSRGAVGLMQLMPRTARSLGVDNRFNPEDNLRGGARYLKKLYKRFGSWPLALAAYNAGPSNVVKYDGVPPFKETKRYVNKVMRYYDGVRESRGLVAMRKSKGRKGRDTSYRLQSMDQIKPRKATRRDFIVHSRSRKFATSSAQVELKSKTRPSHRQTMRSTIIMSKKQRGEQKPGFSYWRHDDDIPTIRVARLE